MERKNQRLRTSYRCHPERSAAESKDLVEVAATRRGLPRPLNYSQTTLNNASPIRAVGRTQNYPIAPKYDALLHKSKTIYDNINFCTLFSF